MLNEKEELLKKLIKINICEIEEKTKKLGCEFSKYCEEELPEESRLQGLFESTFEIKESIRKFKLTKHRDFSGI
ncbi:MAG: hypothetical protein ACYDDB_04085 [bacterium]